MKTKYWLKLILFCSSLFAVGLFAKYYGESTAPMGACPISMSQGFPILCREKISIHQAGVAELALVDGVSQKKARAIKSYLKLKPKATVDHLAFIKGIGPKTVIKLGEYFY